jgi:nucleotide-binding universal stress UspA family protein
VLIALDGSPLAERALPIGIGLARLLDGDVHLLRVASRLDTTAAMTYLEDAAVALQLQDLADVPRSVMTGAAPGGAIRTYAHEHGVGLIALASHGRGGLSRVVLGSVAMEVVTTAAIPIVVVPPRVRLPLRLRASAGRTEPNPHDS